MLLASLASAAGCTAIVLSDASGADAPCADEADCASGQRCEDDVCVDDDRDPALPPSPARVGPDGGTVPGPDGVVLTIPAGALDGEIDIEIVRTSSTTPLDDGLAARSRFYSIGPDVTLGAAATLALPLEAVCAGCAVYREGSAGFVELAVVDSSADSVSCTTASFGLFVAAEEAP